MTARRRRAGAVVALSGLALLAGCVRPVDIAGGTPACVVGDGDAARGVLLMAQAVPSASWVPCLDDVPNGWHFAGMEASDGEARFWLDSDRDGVHAIEVQLAETCDTERATEIPSDREPLRRFERVTEVSPSEMAEPPTTVLETAVVDSVTTVACPKVRPGIVASRTNW